MDKLKNALRSATALAIASLVLAGCNTVPPAVIKYEQRGACNGFTHAGGTTSAGPQRAYVVFRVSTIANTGGAKAVDFPFDPERLYVDQSTAAFVDSDIQISALNPFALTGRLVKAGTTETFNGAAIAVVATTDADGAREANQTKYTLRYSAPSNPGGLTEDADPAKTSWAYTPNCSLIRF